MTTSTSKAGYRCIATSVEGFIQQVAVSYIRTGHFFYVAGNLSAGADAAAVDAKIIAKYSIDASRWTRALRKSRGETNLQYIRHDRFFLIMATHGVGTFFVHEGEQVRDCRRRPIKFAGYSLSYRNGHPHVRIDLETYLGFKAAMVERALRASRADLEEQLRSPVFIPYAPVRRQLWNVGRMMNRVRAAAGLEPLHLDRMELRRRIVRPFGDLDHTGKREVGHDENAKEDRVDDVDEWKELSGPRRAEPQGPSLVGLPRVPTLAPTIERALSPSSGPASTSDGNAVDPAPHYNPKPKSVFPEDWGQGERLPESLERTRPTVQESLWPTKPGLSRGRGPERGR